MSYPWYNDPEYGKKILSKKEIYDNRNGTKSTACLADYQRLVSNYINPLSPYKALMLYFQVGSGKTLSAIAIAENFIRYNNSKIVVITKNEDLALNFKNELLTVCSDYTTTEELKILKSDGEEKRILMKKLNMKIRQNYTFLHHEQFKNSVSKGTIKNLSDKIIIIDEFHKLIGNKGYDVIMKVLEKTKNYRLVLLSATPVYDKIIDAFEISNVLNGKKELPTGESLKKTNYIKRNKDVEDISIFNDDEIYSLTTEGKKILTDRMKGKAVYLKTPEINFPSYTEEGNYIEIKSYKSDIKVVQCKMSEFQEKRYLKIYEALKNIKTDFNLNLEYASSIIYPDNQKGEIVFSKAGFETYIKKSNDISFLKKENLYNYSTKLYSLLDNVQKSEGKIFIFSNYITDDGIELIERMFIANKISKYTILTSSKDAKQRQRIISRFNSPENDNGNDIKIILASKVISEGITLKSVRQVHIYEPAWNLSSLDQVIGRVIRNNSHASLPIQKRNVRIFRYCSITKDTSLSSDASKYIKAGRKDKYIKEYERMIAKSSFSCELLKKTNVSSKYSDGSRECDYMNCNYTCDINQLPGEIDNSTYNVYYHDNYLYKTNVSKIKKLFDVSKNWSLDDIAKKINLSKIDVKGIMRRIIEGNNMFSIKGNYYTLSTNIAKKQQNNGYVEDIYFKNPIAVKSSTKPILAEESSSKPISITKPEKLVTQVNRIIKPSSIVTTPTTVRAKTDLSIRETEVGIKVFLKKTSRGKICTSYSKDEILEFFVMLGIDKPSSRTKKEDLCKILKDYSK